LRNIKERRRRRRKERIRERIGRNRERTIR
jgi:hypothetical protein